MNVLPIHESLQAAEEDFEAWVRSAQKGDQEAFGRLVHRFWPKLLGLARSLAIDESLAEDLLQDTFLRAWRRLGSLREPAAFGFWLRRILLRIGLKRIRGKQPTVPLESIEPVAPQGPSLLDVPKLLADLPPRQRAVLYLTAVEGLSDREVAETLGLGASTVRVHRMRARRALARRMQEPE